MYELSKNCDSIDRALVTRSNNEIVFYRRADDGSTGDQIAMGARYKNSKLFMSPMFTDEFIIYRLKEEK